MLEKHGKGTLSAADIRQKREKNKVAEIKQIAKEQEANGIFDGDSNQGPLVDIVQGEIGTDMGTWDENTKQEFVDYRIGVSLRSNSTKFEELI